MCHLVSPQSYDISKAIECFRPAIIKVWKLQIDFSNFISAVKLPYEEQYEAYYNFTYAITSFWQSNICEEKIHK